MDINQKAKEFAKYIRNTNEFKSMNKSKLALEKNRTIKRKLDSYISKKNSIYSNYRIDEASAKINQLNQEYSDFFNQPIVAEYMNSTKQFNSMMETLYKSIENELLK